MKAEQVTAFVLELGCLRDFPSWNTAAVEKIAEQVARLCSSPSQAKRLVDEMTSGRFDAWPGPATLKGVYEELYPPDKSYNPGWVAYMPTPPECKVCCDTGAVRGEGDWGRCACDAGQTVEQSHVDELNELLERGRRITEQAKRSGRRMKVAGFMAAREILQ